MVFTNPFSIQKKVMQTYCQKYKANNFFRKVFFVHNDDERNIIMANLNGPYFHVL